MSKIILKGIINRYKPIDKLLRKNGIYFKISIFLYSSIYVPFLKSSMVSAHAESYYKQFYIISVDKKVALLDSFWGRKIGCNPYAIFLEMYNRPEFYNVQFYWTKEADVDAPHWMEEDIRITFVERHSPEYVTALLSAKYLIANANLPYYFVRKSEQYYVNTWHGIPLKYMGQDVPKPLKSFSNTQRNFSHSTHILLASKYATEKTVLPYGDIGSQNRVFHIGSPRVDLTLKANYCKVQRGLKVPIGKKLILYAPTWRGKVEDVSTSIDEQLEVLLMLEKRFGEQFLIMVSIHNYDKSKLEKLPNNCVLVPDNMNINEILSGVDILISDYSSIFFDFLVLDRPTILHVNDLEHYQAEHGLYLNLHEIPVNITKTLGELENAIKKAQKPSLNLRYKDFMNLVMPLEDAHASVRAVDLLSQTLKILPSTLNTNKKSILFYAGSFANSNNTFTLFNLLNSLDLNRFEIFLVVHSQEIDRSPKSRALFEEIPIHCKIILRADKISIAKSDFRQMTNWKSGNEALNLDAIDAAFSHEIRRVLSDREFDYAVDYTGYSSFWAKFISLTLSKKTLIYQHDNLMDVLHSPLKSAKQLFNVFATYKNFDKIVSVSPTLREINLKNLGKYYGSKEKAVCVRNVIIPEQIRQKASENISLLAELNILSHIQEIIKNDIVVKFVTIGSLTVEKNQILLIRAMKKIIDSGVDAFLFIVGDGNQMKALVKETKKLKMTNFVLFTGSIENPLPIVKLSDCFVLPSNYEGQPMVLLEALTLGKYCIGSDISTIEDVLNGNGVTAKRTPEDFANAMIDFASHKQERTKSINFDAKAYHQMVMNEFYDMLES